MVLCRVEMSQRFHIGSAAEQISQLLNSSGAKLRRLEIRQKLLRHLLGAGFDRARFYEWCTDIREPDGMFILVCEEVAARGRSRSNVGLCVPATSGSIGYDLDANDTVFWRSADDYQPQPAWITELDLEGRVWIDINLRVVGESVGAIALDWVGNKDDLVHDDARILAGVGTLIAQHIQLRPIDRVQTFRSDISQKQDELRGEALAPEERLLSDALQSVAEILDTRIAALFEYRWTTGVLEKTDEYDTHTKSEQPRPKGLLIAEGKYHVGENLTGRAWIDPKYRHVPLLSHLNGSSLLSKESLDTHEEYMGSRPFTCLYGRINSMEPRYMIRLMNRRGLGRVPYVGERHLLEAILEELRVEVDKATALGRTASLETGTRLAAQNTDPSAMLAALSPLLEREDVYDILVWCHRANSDQFSFRGSYGEMWQAESDLGFVEWTRDPLYASTISRQRDVDVIPQGLIRKAAATGKATGYGIAAMFPDDAAGALAIRLAAGQTSGLMLVPLAADSPVRRRTFLEDVGVGRLGLLKAYGSLLADVIDSSFARARSDGARRALGVLGHELATPLAALGTTAESALREIRLMASTAQGCHAKGDGHGIQEAVDEIRIAAVGYGEKVRAERRSIGAAMSLAPLVAQESADGRLELQMRSCDLGELTLRAITQAAQEARDQRLSRKDEEPPTFEFRRDEKVLGLGRIVADRGLLFLAILNVLRNAYKYSIPDPSTNTCRIQVSGQRQRGMRIISVTNTGRGIDPDAADHIFEPWVRLESEMNDTARTGMGIGLFFSKRIALAHGGTVLCTASRPLLEATVRAGDSSTEELGLDRMISRAGMTPRGSRHQLVSLGPEPGELPRRYTTTFEIRVSDAIEPGAHVQEWSRAHAAVGTRRRSM